MYQFENLSGDLIYVVGDVMIDHYIYGNCDRISPEAPVLILDTKKEEYTLGGAGNVVKNLISLGAKAGVATVCGNDEGLSLLDREFEQLQVVNRKLLIDHSRRTTVKSRVVSGNHQLLRIDKEDKHPITDETGDGLVQDVEANLGKIKILIISDYCKGGLNANTIQRLIKLCRENHVITIVDSKDPDLSKFSGATIIKPNRKEAQKATGIQIVDEATLTAACRKIAEQAQCDSVVITLSEEGMAIFHEGKLSKIPTRALEIFDVTGAGDTVVASLAFALLNGMTLIQACDFANHAAAVVVAKVGSATATLDEINSFNK
jgi:D-beta-D-heptose 7-phosphate kinase/D-beta-D-heptose 1-phosphate adenosyltransferase